MNTKSKISVYILRSAAAVLLLSYLIVAFFSAITPMATGEPTPLPPCTPGPWSTASPYPITDVRYGFAQTATHFYVFGGVSNGTRVNSVNRLVLATGMWEARAAMPFTSEAPTCALMASTGIVYCAEGDTGSGFASYNIATNTWASLASIPGGNHYGSASGAFNGKVFVAGGTTAPTSAVQVYDLASNTWSAGTAAPNDFLVAGYQQVGQYLYVVGGFEAGGPDKVAGELSSVLNRGQQSKEPKVPMANNMTTWRLDMTSAPGVWTVGPAFTMGRADFGLAYDPVTNTLYALGGDAQGGGFFDSTNEVDELSVGSWPAGSWVASPPNLILPTRQANQAGFYAAGQIWTVGGLVGQTFQYLAEVQHRSDMDPCCTPGQYAIGQIGGSIVPGTTDSGNHGDDVVTNVPLPFPFTLYDTPFTSINVSSNGPTQFTTTDPTFTNICLPWLAHDYSVFPYWDDQRTDNMGWVGCTTYPNGQCGVFTSVSGTAPNRIFNIEWRAVYFANTAQQANYELRLYEGQTRFDIIYGTVANGNSSATAGVQKNDTAFTQYFCNGVGGAAGGGQSYTQEPCLTPTPTPTATHAPTATPTATATATHTPTPTPTPMGSIFVPAVQNFPGVDTGVDLVAGHSLQISASGFATYGLDVACGVNGTPQTDPDGLRYINGSPCPPKYDSSATLPTAPIGSLLGRIGGGGWFLVGTSYSSSVAVNGRLFLIYNDVPSLYGDNNQGYDAVISTAPTSPPIVTTGAATNVTSSSATLHGTVDPNGLSTNVHFEYGTTTSYGLSTASQNFSGNTTQPVTAAISGLNSNTTYHFRLVGTNSGGRSFGYDVTFRFDTNATGPVIVTTPATNVMTSSATLNGTVNPKGLTTSVYFQYGASASYGFTTVAQSYSGSTTQPVSANIPGLGPSTTYHFRLVGMNSGGTSFGSDRTFTTLAAGTAPVITSPATARATVGQLFAYQITAANGPTSYAASPLPQGITFDGVRGILSGTPTNRGMTNIQLTASNSHGMGTRTLTLGVQLAPSSGFTIASATSITARKGQFFSFQVFTTGGSTNARLTATHLPPGLSADRETGFISGTPTANGSFLVTLTVTDGSVTATSTLQLTITSDPAIPVISSPREVTLVPGQFFSYRIVDSSKQSGTTFSIIGQLPPGLTLNPATGVISGVYNPPDVNGGPLLGSFQIICHNLYRNAVNPLILFGRRPCTLLKIATRGVVQTGNNQLVGGVNVAGNAKEKVMVRAIGPSLRVNSVPLTGRLQNPTLELDHPYSISIGQNDNWQTTVIGGIIDSNQVAAIQNSHLLNSSVSLKPTNLLESAIIAKELESGNYKAIVRPKSGTTGTVGSVEFYDLGTVGGFNFIYRAGLIDFAARGLVQTGNNVMRTDFTLGSQSANGSTGSTGSPVRILLRVQGPSLPVQGRLQNPTLGLYKGNGVGVAYNDDWMSAPNHQKIYNTGYAPSNPHEPAILIDNLSQDNYYAVVRGLNNTTGIAVLQAYILLPPP